VNFDVSVLEKNEDFGEAETENEIFIQEEATRR
jgi:hypothetical protein